MRTKEVTSESPQKVQATDFGLGPHTVQHLQDLLKKKEIIRDTKEYELFRTGEGDCFNFLGQTVTQVALWRRTDSPYVQGLTKEISFDYLLKRYPTILSDKRQMVRNFGEVGLLKRQDWDIKLGW